MRRNAAKGLARGKGATKRAADRGFQPYSRCERMDPFTMFSWSYKGSPVLWASGETHLNMLSYRIGPNLDFKVQVLIAWHHFRRR